MELRERIGIRRGEEALVEVETLESESASMTPLASSAEASSSSLLLDIPDDEVLSWSITATLSPLLSMVAEEEFDDSDSTESA